MLSRGSTRARGYAAPGMAPVTEWIDDPARFEAIRDEWDRLAVLDPSPFSLHAWYAAWWRAFGGGTLHVCVVREGDELVGGLPLGMANEHSPSFRPLARDDAALEALVAALLDQGSPVELVGLPLDEAVPTALVKGLELGGARLLIETDYVSPIADTTGSFEEYRAALKAGWKETERRGRKMTREHEVEQVLVEPPTELERALEEGLALEASGWKGREGTAILADESTAAFYRDLARAFHERGELRFSALRVDGRLVAFDFALLHENRYFLLKTAYDEELRKLGPGLVMRRAVIERCFELGLDAHEFLGPDMEWKRLFATGARPHAVVRAYPRGPGGTARYAYRAQVRPRLKAAYRRVRPRTTSPRERDRGA